METIHWWWLSSPCLCNLSWRHTEISSLITDYYHKWDVLWSCLCHIDGCYACCLIYCDRSRRHKDPEPHAFLFLSYVMLLICDSSKKYFPLKCSSLWFEFSQFRSSSQKTNSLGRSHENAKCKRFSSEFHFVALKFFRFSSIILQELNWLIVILDKNERTIFNKVNYVFLCDV